MARSDAFITVECDSCGYSDQYELCALAGGGWDERDIDRKLRRQGWEVKDGKDLCSDCVENAKDKEEVD